MKHIVYFNLGFTLTFIKANFLFASLMYAIDVNNVICELLSILTYDNNNVILKVLFKIDLPSTYSIHLYLCQMHILLPMPLFQKICFENIRNCGGYKSFDKQEVTNVVI